MTTSDTPIDDRGNPAAILAVVLGSYFMILLDNSIIFTALPTIRTALDLSVTGLSWVQDAYTLVFGGLLLLGARAGDLLGRRRVFITGLAVFSIASLLVGVAPSGWWMIAARALQGVGAAIVAPTSLSLLTASFPEGPLRSRAVAWYGATAGIGASLGLVLGGALADWISWRAGFFLNVPIGIAMIVLAPRYLPETARSTGRFDVAGAVSATLGVGAIVFGVINSGESGWASPVTVWALLIGVILLAVLVAGEKRAEQPIMPLRLFGDRQRVGAYLARLLYMGAMIGFFYFTTQFMQNVLGFSALQAGVAFLPMTVVNFVVAMAIPRLVARFGEVLPLLGGIALTLAGMVWLSGVAPGSSYWVGVAAPMLLIGAGQGLAFAPLTSAGIAGVPARDAGAASGLVNTFHQLGMALGLGILVAISANTEPEQSSAVEAMAALVRVALAGASALLGVCLLVACALIGLRPGRARQNRVEGLRHGEPIAAASAGSN
ncbi:MFS transporter [Nocardia sp. A7]|uniref:MFS transporter n=1 Tax=Nocardia sp. A7 TaxID=2789274 RepID=UPI00397D185E